jgi:hypothetical protein
MVCGGKIPIAVIDRIINGTITELQLKPWLPMIEQIIAASEGVAPEAGNHVCMKHGTEGTTSRSCAGGLTATTC